jgi:signal transduction histidine kinase
VLRQAALRCDRPQQVWVTLRVDPPVLPAKLPWLTDLIAAMIQNAVAVSPPTSKVHIISSPLAGGVRISVSDSGNGLLPNQAAALTKALNSPLSPPTNTALSIAAQRAAKLNGRITIAAHYPDAGTTVAADLPVTVFVGL